MDLLRQVFGKHERDAYALSMLIERRDKAECGPFPPSVAEALFDAAQERIRAEGHTLQITSEPAGETVAPDPSEIQFEWAHDALAWHFADIPPNSLVNMVRQFPGHMRADVQSSLRRSASLACSRDGLLRSCHSRSSGAPETIPSCWRRHNTTRST
nr:ATP-dependent Clp protease adaptor ClpS [Bradyrhizobium sp. Gha]